tara:strand:+ start:2479 stop:2733 length:255 start_codon:yes stop_codon:yes gene_type:complete
MTVPSRPESARWRLKDGSLAMLATRSLVAGLIAVVFAAFGKLVYMAMLGHSDTDLWSTFCGGFVGAWFALVMVRTTKTEFENSQ